VCSHELIDLLCSSRTELLGHRRSPASYMTQDQVPHCCAFGTVPFCIDLGARVPCSFIWGSAPPRTGTSMIMHFVGVEVDEPCDESGLFSGFDAH
jgi:hypothetical protein